MPRRLVVGQRTLDPLTEVRILAGQPAVCIGGDVPEWPGSGLQNRVHGFDSRRRLHRLSTVRRPLAASPVGRPAGSVPPRRRTSTPPTVVGGQEALPVADASAHTHIDLRHLLDAAAFHGADTRRWRLPVAVGSSIPSAGESAMRRAFLLPAASFSLLVSACATASPANAVTGEGIQL